jgi:hypothetical protein
VYFPVFTPETAPEASRPLLEQTARRLGFVPNLTGELAASPAAVEGTSPCPPRSRSPA